MVNRIAEQQKAICVVLASDRKAINLLFLLDFDIIDAIITVLKPLRELTDILAAEKRVSVLAVKPLVQRICNTMLATDDEDTDLAKEIVVTFMNMDIFRHAYTLILDHYVVIGHTSCCRVSIGSVPLYLMLL